MVQITHNVPDAGQDCFKVATPEATYFYQKAAGGFSSMLDRDGNDWLGFQPHPSPSYPASAANAYRGMPNLCNSGAEHGLGHPGFRKAVSRQVGDNRVESQSLDGLWRWRWTFFDSHAQLDLLAVSPSRPYWFLFEGNPLGEFAPEHQYWLTDRDGLRSDKPDYVKDEVAEGPWRWLCLGDRRSSQSLLLAQDRVYVPQNCFAFLGNSANGLQSNDGMMVLGFGRDTAARECLSEAGTRFYVAFIAKTILDSSLPDHIETTLRTVGQQAT